MLLVLELDIKTKNCENRC